MTNQQLTLLAAALQGLCAAPEVAQRSPKSIAQKALKIVDEVEAVINA